MKKTKFLFVVLISFLMSWTQSVKADTIPYHLPGSAQLCQDPLAYDTFVFHKPAGFGPTVWYIGEVYIGTGDSIIFTPSNPGAYFISSKWGDNIEPFMLSVYTAQPSHATFAVFNGGIINTTNDTAYICGMNELSLGANSSGGGNLIWYGPGGFTSTSNPIMVTMPGIYVYQKSNPCGITRDTIVVIKLPTTLPVWTDTVFCNTSVSLTLDPGPGWNYTWQDGSHDQTFVVSDSGTYSCHLSNVCTTGDTVSLYVEYQQYPLPDLTYQQAFTFCYDEVVELDPSPGYLYDTYQWTPPSGVTVTTPTFSATGTTGNGGYFLTVTQGGCAESIVGEFNFFSPPRTPEICVVTVNTTLDKNMVVWTTEVEPLFGDPEFSACASYNIYKAKGFNSWSLIGTVPVGDEHIFVDQSSSPPMAVDVYKITMVDACGVESAKSFYHKTILLAVNQGANPGQVPLIWNAYEDESGEFVVDKYYIYRGDSPDAMVLYDSVPGYSTSFVDTGVTTQKHYQIVVLKAGGCNSSPTKGKGFITGIQSNMIRTTTGIHDYTSVPIITIYPNPSTGVFTLEGDDILRVEVTDLMGRVLRVVEYPPSTLDLSEFANGMYNALITTAQGSTNRTLMIMR